MSLYQETIAFLLKTAADDQTRAAQEQRDRQSAALAEMLSVAHAITLRSIEELLGKTNANLSRDESGNAMLTIDGEFTLTKNPGRQALITMLPNICSQNCQARATDRQEFLTFVERHITFGTSHDPVPRDVTAEVVPRSPTPKDTFEAYVDAVENVSTRKTK